MVWSLQSHVTYNSQVSLSFFSSMFLPLFDLSLFFSLFFISDIMGQDKVLTAVTCRFSDDPRFANIYFAKIDVDALPDLSQELGISAMPTFISFKGGERNDKVIGANPKGVENLLVSLL
jgi:hypothetical protein